VRNSAAIIVLPPLSYITPPVKVIDIQQTAPAGDPPMWVFQGAGEITGVKMNTTIQGGVYYRVDTGALVTLDNPDNLRESRTLEVQSCLDINGSYTTTDAPPSHRPPRSRPSPRTPSRISTGAGCQARCP
jgi:hypothetical protein